jgi:hypothetical protein
MADKRPAPKGDVLGQLGAADPETVEEFSEYLAQRKVNARHRWSTAEAVDALRETCNAFHARETFKPGDVVRWKERLRNRSMPPYDIPAVVVEILPEPILDTESSSGTTSFREPLDIVIALYVDSDSGEDEGVGIYHFDSRRFELHPDFN